MKKSIYLLLISPIVLISFTSFSQNPTVGNSIQGDFDGDGKKEFAFSVQTKEAVGNPMEDGVAAEFAMNFSDAKFPSLNVGCCEITLVNEGDLNNDGKDDLSIYQAPHNGTVYSITTYSFKDGKWNIIVPNHLIPSGGDFDSKEIQGLVFLEKGVLYYLDTDVNDENFRQFKVKVN